jgi:hypothetical protein
MTPIEPLDKPGQWNSACLMEGNRYEHRFDG